MSHNLNSIKEVILGLGCRFEGLGFRVEDLGFRV